MRAAGFLLCVAAHYEFTIGGLFHLYLENWQEKRQKPDLLNAFAIPSSSDLVHIFSFCSEGTRLIFAGPCGRTNPFVIYDLQSRNHETLAGSLKFITEMWLLSLDDCHWTVPFMSCQWHVLNDACWRHLVQMSGVSESLNVWSVWWQTMHERFNLKSAGNLRRNKAQAKSSSGGHL